MSLEICIALVAPQLSINLSISLLLLGIETLHKLLDVGHAISRAVVLPRGRHVLVDIHDAGMKRLPLYEMIGDDGPCRIIYLITSDKATVWNQNAENWASNKLDRIQL